MATEIERKFIVKGSEWPKTGGIEIAQGYLNRDKERTVRVRMVGDSGFLAVKGLTRGATRLEFEYPIPAQDAAALLTLCDGPTLRKVRHTVRCRNTKWEIDVFEGENAGLIVAEVELEHEDQAFDRPDWLGKEVTHDRRYFNSNLAAKPFRSWGSES